MHWINSSYGHTIYIKLPMTFQPNCEESNITVFYLVIFSGLVSFHTPERAKNGENLPSS